MSCATSVIPWASSAMGAFLLRPVLPLHETRSDDQGSCHLHCAERAWETVDELAPDEDASAVADYRSLTRRLKEVSEPTAPPLGSSPEQHPSGTGGHCHLPMLSGEVPSMLQPGKCVRTLAWKPPAAAYESYHATPWLLT